MATIKEHKIIYEATSRIVLLNSISVNEQVFLMRLLINILPELYVDNNIVELSKLTKFSTVQVKSFIKNLIDNNLINRDKRGSNGRLTFNFLSDFYDKYKKVETVDVKESIVSYYRNMTYITQNICLDRDKSKELKDLINTALNIVSTSDIKETLNILKKSIYNYNLYMYCYLKGDVFLNIPNVEIEEFFKLSSKNGPLFLNFTDEGSLNRELTRLLTKKKRLNVEREIGEYS